MTSPNKSVGSIVTMKAWPPKPVMIDYDHCAPKRGITNYDNIMNIFLNPNFRRTNMMIKTPCNHFEETDENYVVVSLHPLYVNLSTFSDF
jgi:hypothetical protein